MNVLPVVFPCEDQALLGLIHGSAIPAATGVLIVVGGPQYRVGSHRQFLLLARALADAGIPAMRFDYRGMGDSGGACLGFEHIDRDIQTAIDVFFEQSPSVKRVVIWGLCDAASAALFYAYQDKRVAGLILLNPWVRTEQGEAQAYIKHYYLQRLFSRELWIKILRGRFQFANALGSFWEMFRKSQLKSPGDVTGGRIDQSQPLPQRMLAGLQAFEGRVCFILSGDDLTAAEFKDTVSGSQDWQQTMAGERVTRIDFKQANHTFSKQSWRTQVEQWTVDWVQSIFD